MNYVVHHWSLDPMIVVLALTVIAHEVGLRRMASHSTIANRRRRRRRSYRFYAGLALLAVVIVSPLDYWASRYFFVHMIEHIIIAFFVPMLIVAGAPWIPTLFVLPVAARRRLGRFLFLRQSTAWLRAVGRFARNPWFALVLMNVVMFAWHVPSLFDLAERNQFVHVWLMHGSFVVAGTLFWLQIYPSAPMRPAKGAVWKIGAILITNGLMTMLAISMSILTTVSWYAVYAHVPGVTLSPFADQQIGAAILWICGDFWALPTLAIVIRRAIETEGSMGSVIDRLTGRASTLDLTISTPAPTSPVDGAR